jgi:hypothetical protein
MKIGIMRTENMAAEPHGTSGVVNKLTEGSAESSVDTKRAVKKLFAK